MTVFSKHRITFFYLLTAFIFFIAGFSQTAGDALDISIHHTYYVISKASIYFGIGIFFLLFSATSALFIYLKKPLRFSLSIIHFTLTLIALTGLYYTGTHMQVKTPERFSDYSVMNDLNQITSTTKQLSIGLIFYGVLILVSQLLFTINVLFILFRKTASGK